MGTIISWTNETWNPTTGCSKISEGCRNCYAERLSLKHGWSTKPWTARNAKSNIILHPDRLDIPRSWKTPKRCFVNSMSDLFHEEIPDAFIAQVFRVMNDLPQHTFQILTKRPERAAEWPGPWGENIWQGTSVEDRKSLHRIDTLRACKAKLLFLSLEPLLEDLGELNLAGYGWVIVGGESGTGFRPMEHAWARSIRNQCVARNIPFFFKQSAAARTETGKSLSEEDGTKTIWQQYPSTEKGLPADPFAAALFYLHELELSPLALCPPSCDCGTPGKVPHTKNWQAACAELPDEDELRADFQRLKGNVGIAAGLASGVIIVDCDAEEAHQYLVDTFDIPADTPSVRSGRAEGGYHHYFLFDAAIDSQDVVVGGFKYEIKAAGKQVVAPPSLHLSGKRYRWIVPFNRDALRPIPPAFLAAAEKSHTTRAKNAGKKAQKAQIDRLDPNHPFEVYNSSDAYQGLLTDAGWTFVETEGDFERWRRPGKPDGHSATFNTTLRTFWIYSTDEAIRPFQAGTVYFPFSMLALFKFGGVEQEHLKQTAEFLNPDKPLLPPEMSPPETSNDEPLPPNGPEDEPEKHRTMEEVWQDIAPPKPAKAEETTPQDGQVPSDTERETEKQDTPPTLDVEAVKQRLWDAVDDALHWQKKDMGIFCDRVVGAYSLSRSWLSDWQAAVSEAKRTERAQQKAKQAEKQNQNQDVPSDGSVKEGDTCYVKRELIMGIMAVEKPISSFLIKPKLRVWIDGKEHLKADFVTPAKTYPDAIIRRRDWNTNDRFMDAFPSVDLQWQGGSFDVQEVLRIVAGYKVPVKQGTTQLGWQANGLWVLPDGAFDSKGRVNDSDLVYLPLGGSGELDDKISVSDIDDAAYQSLLETIYLNLPAVNLPEVTIPVIGWFCATPFKPMFSAKYESFPHLSISGTRGAGKSTLLRLMWRMVGIKAGGKLFSCTETDFVMLKLLSATTSIPIAFDEYKPYDMPNQRLRALTRLLRRAYDGEKEFRGRPDQSTVEYSLSAPIAIAGEVPLTEGALLERIISVEMSPNQLTAQMRKAYRTLQSAPLHAFMTRFIPFALRADFDRELNRAEVLAADLLDIEALPDRVRKNLTVIIFGFNQFIRFGVENGILDDADDQTAILGQAVTAARDAVCGSDGVTKVALDYLLEHLATMAETERLKAGRDFVIRETYGDIAIRFDSCFAEFRKFHRETQLDGELLNAQAYRRQMRENYERGGYITDTNIAVKFQGTNKKCVIIDPIRAEKMGIDLGGFEGNEEGNRG